MPRWIDPIVHQYSYFAKGRIVKDGRVEKCRLLMTALHQCGLLPVSWTLCSGVKLKPEVVYRNEKAIQPGVQS